jgi:large subunit ribosomal protein L15
MLQRDLRPPRGAKHKRKRVGRGNASGHGTYSTRGLKGQKARSGSSLHLGFEGGQLPLIQRLSRKRGFTNIFRVEYAEVNLRSLVGRFPAGSDVTPEALVRAGVIKNLKRPVKVLAQGDLEGALTVHAHKFSSAAREKIEAAGGKAEVIQAAGAKVEVKTSRAKVEAIEADEAKVEVTEAPGAKAEVKTSRAKVEAIEADEAKVEVTEAPGAKAEAKKATRRKAKVTEAAVGEAEVVEAAEGTAEVVEE